MTKSSSLLKQVANTLMVVLAVFSTVCVLSTSPAFATPNTSSSWVIQKNPSWARWAPLPFRRWDLYNDLNDRVQLVADPTTRSAVYFLKLDGSVGYRNVDQNINTAFPGITATQIAVGQNGRLWAITTDGRWARWAPGPNAHWDIYNDLDNRVQLVGDPRSEGGIYFRKADGTVGFRDVDQNTGQILLGVLAKDLTVSDPDKES